MLNFFQETESGIDLLMKLSVIVSFVAITIIKEIAHTINKVQCFPPPNSLKVKSPPINDHQ